jgi:hypothetical protein
MSGIESIDYKYLGVAVVFLLLAFFYLTNIKNEIRQHTNSKTFNSSVKVLTSKGEIYMDPNIFEKHMERIKETIINIHQNFDKRDCPKLKIYLDNAKIQTAGYIQMNKKDINTDFCNVDNKLDLFDDNILKERTLLKKKLDVKTKLDDNDDDTISDKMKYNLLELIIDIDIIIFLVKSSICKKGTLDLSSLDQVILEMYRNNCKDDEKTEAFNCSDNVCSLNTPTPCYDEKNPYHDISVQERLELGSRHPNKCDFSQTISDTEIAPLKETFQRKPINNYQTDMSHSSEKPFSCNEVRLGKQLKHSYTGLGSLEWYRANDKRTKVGLKIDTSGRTCLGN